MASEPIFSVPATDQMKNENPSKEHEKMIKSTVKSITPDKYWNRLSLLRETIRNKRSAKRYFTEIIKKAGPVLTDSDKSIIDLFPENFDTVLDVGCGGGRLSYALVQAGYKVTAIEPAYWYRKKVQEFISTHLSDGNFTMLDGDIHNLDFPDDLFDVVISAATIEHIEMPEKGVGELIRIAKKCVIITTPVGNTCLSPDHRHVFFRQDIDELFDGYDYEVRIIKTGACSQIETFIIRVNLA